MAGNRNGMYDQQNPFLSLTQHLSTIFLFWEHAAIVAQLAFGHSDHLGY